MPTVEPMKTQDVETGGVNVPIARLSEVSAFAPAEGLGASRYQTRLSETSDLDALLVNKGSDVLVVAFHGATMRAKYKLPRFEWLATLRDTEYSSLYFSDPTLHLSKALELGWYTGWRDMDLFPVLAAWSTKAAETVGASRVVFAGASGGGYAAMQVSALAPGTVAVACNPQTHIAGYRFVDGRRIIAQERYAKIVMPHLLETFYDTPPDRDWSESLGARSSVLRRYSQPVSNRVLYVQNRNDASHMKHHAAPFREAVDASGNAERVRWEWYDGPHGHEAPGRGLFRRVIDAGAAWLEE